MPLVERYHKNCSGSPGMVNKVVPLGHRDGERLLHTDVFAGLQGCNADWVVEVVWQYDVDGINPRILNNALPIGRYVASTELG
jgi:hypothetical protein